MDKFFDKQMVRDEYLLSGISYREPEKEYGVSWLTINRRVLDYQGMARYRIHRL